jgi:hypothetical protein
MLNSGKLPVIRKPFKYEVLVFKNIFKAPAKYILGPSQVKCCVFVAK